MKQLRTVSPSKMAFSSPNRAIYATSDHGVSKCFYIIKKILKCNENTDLN
jgi:hypothetical protein